MTTKERYRTRLGRLSKIYSKIMERSAAHGYKEIISRSNFMAFAERNNDAYEQLFIKWEKSGYDMALTPTIDRINNDGIYEESNIQFLTHSKNAAKGNVDTKTGIAPSCSTARKVVLTKGKERMTFQSGKEACDFFGLSYSRVAVCISRHRPLRGWDVSYA